MAHLRKQSQTAHPLQFLLVSSTDHITGVTGVTPTVKLSKNGAAGASPAGAVSEIDATNAPGWYQVAGNAIDAGTLGPLILHATATGADPCDVDFQVVAFDPDSATNMGLSALPTASPAANGGLPTVDASNNVHGLQVRTVSDASVIGTGTSTYAGTDTSGTTTLLTRVPSALTITGGKVDVNDKTGFTAAASNLPASYPIDFTTALPGSPTAGTVGEALKRADALTGDAYARLGAPAGASVSADIAAVKTDTGNLISRLGAFTGSGINTVLGFLKALLRKDAALTPSDVGGTFDNTTDSTQAIRDQGDAAWTTGAGGTGGTLKTVINENRSVANNPR